MSTGFTLEALPVEVLEAALAKAREREAEALKAKWPKCKCGKPVTQICYPNVSYMFRDVYERNGRPVVNYEHGDENDNPPGADECDASLAWGACDDEKCTTSEWAKINQDDLSWG